MRALGFRLSALGVGLSALGAFGVPAYADDNMAAQDLKRLSIEELMQIDVTSTARRAEPVGGAAAAVQVLTHEDIRRSGATTVADLLRMADGVHVARFNNGSWSISARGFNGQTPNKLLVMVDGRTVYTPFYAGVFWNTVDYVLEDIERIEVIRGPGATLWGANAVNGVINIITRSSRDTRGAYVGLSTGNEERGIVEARYGGGAGDVSWRLFGKIADTDAQTFASGASSGDASRRGQAGFRLDGGTMEATNWRLSGTAFHSREELPDRRPSEFTDLALQGRVSHPLSPASRVDVQSYYRREYRRVPQQLTHHLETIDVDAQQSYARGRHNAVWGAGYRINWDGTHGSPALQFTPAARRYFIASVFAEDEFTLVPQRLFATAGVKYERNTFGSGELQPNLRARLMLPRGQVLWGAVSRAVRRPTRFDNDIEIYSPTGMLLVAGTGDFEAESLIATEAGYRVRPLASLSLDATVFHHRFTDLRSQDAPTAGGLPITIGNSLEGEAHGLELSVNVQPVAWWRSHAGLQLLHTSIERAPGSRDISGGVSEANDPPRWLKFGTSLDLSHNVEVDVHFRALAALPNPVVPEYAEVNGRVGWNVNERVEIWLVGDDLLHDHHPEFGPAAPARVEFERGIRLGTTLRF